MTEPEQTDSNDEIEQAYGEPQYTVRLNGTEFELNEDARESIQSRARHEYKENEMFSCFWKVAAPEQYGEDEWEDTIHDAGDPVLVIETEGPMVPWERLDTLDVEMQEVGEESQFDGAGGETQDSDSGNGMKLVPPGDDSDGDEDIQKQIGRTHFGLTPQQFEEVPSPDGEDPDKIPAKPIEMDDEPALVAWIPDDPELEHTWEAGEAICSMYNRVEWNVQKKADQPRLTNDKDHSHDVWESMLQTFGCDDVGEVETEEESSNEEEPDPLDGKYGGNNWQV